MKSKIIFSYFIFAFFILLFSNVCTAAQEYTELNNQWFYIKNAYTGHYLDIANGTAQGGTNVQQYEYNGSSAQKWYISHRGNGEYMICTEVGSTESSDNQLYLNYALDIDNGINANGTNVHIWNIVLDGITQTYSFTKTTSSTYIINTKASNYTKVVSLSNNICNNGVNIHQWEYSGHSHDQWILEPVYLNSTMGANYAKANVDDTIDAYPVLVNTGDEQTNFVCQSLLAGGWHQTSEWFMKRLNVNSDVNYSDSWNATNTWIDENSFYDRYYENDNIGWLIKGSLIINNPARPNEAGFQKGDVVQIVSRENNITTGIIFTAYVTLEGANTDLDGNVYTNLYVTYPNTTNRSINVLANTYGNYYFVFYDCT